MVDGIKRIFILETGMRFQKYKYLHACGLSEEVMVRLAQEY